MRRATLLGAAAIGLWGSMATGATQYIVGYKLIVKDPNGSETKRSFLVLGRQPGFCDATIVGDPVTNGATLTIVANGTTSTSQTFPLPAGAGWSVIGGGFKWVDKAKSQPVHLLQISKKISKDGGTACKFKALVKGADGGTLSVVPPFTGHDGGAILAVNGGDTYCVHLSTDAASIIKMDSP